LTDAIRKMTMMPAQRFRLADRGLVSEGYWADLALFDAKKIIDTATFIDPERAADGIKGVWVNGVLTYTDRGPTGDRAGRFVARGKTDWIQ